MKKQFLKIAGVNSEAAFYKKYPTEGAFFAAHPEAKKMMAMGGTPEAFPQIATFDKAFSYGVPPGPQYLEHGGSAFPQAQTEQQFFIPIYTDVYNPYNKAMGGSNVEMYPNAKTTPHWGPTNIWFQKGGQEGALQEGQDLDRLGTLNKTGAFLNNIKTTAAKANAKNAMMNAINTVGMAKYGKELNTYAPGGYIVNPNQKISSNVTQQMSPTSSQFAGETMPPTYSQQLQENNLAYLNSAGYNPNMAAMMQQAYGYNPMGMGNMNNFLPSIYNWNNPNEFMYRETGSPNWKWKTDIAGMGKRRGVSNIGLGEAWGLYSGDPAAREEALKKLNPSRITETPVGLFKRRMRRDYYWDGTPASTFKDWGTGVQNASSQMPQAPGQQSYDPTVRTAQSAGQPTATPSTSLINPDTDYITNSKYPDLDEKFAGTNMTQRERLLQQLNSNDPKESEYAKYRIGVMQDWDAMQASKNKKSQAPSNADSMDPNVAAKKAAMQNPSINQAYIDAQMQSGPPYKTPVGPVVGPEEFAYGGYSGYKYGGSYRQGDVVYMNDDEIAEFIKNGGQIEEME